MQRIEQKYDRTDSNIYLYVKFEDFGELTMARTIECFTMFLKHVVKLVRTVKKIAIITSNDSLKKKLTIEFKMLPTIHLRTFDDEKDSDAVDLLEINR